MRTVHEVSKLSGVSIRALHHYDKIGLLRPAQVTEAGYRLYDDTNLERLQLILLFRELKFSLKEIRVILDSSDHDRAKILEQQVELSPKRKNTGPDTFVLCPTGWKKRENFCRAIGSL